MTRYRKRRYKRSYNPRRNFTFYNIFSKHHSCKWKYKYKRLQRELYEEANY